MLAGRWWLATVTMLLAVRFTQMMASATDRLDLRMDPNRHHHRHRHKQTDAPVTQHNDDTFDFLPHYDPLTFNEFLDKEILNFDSYINDKKNDWIQMSSDIGELKDKKHQHWPIKREAVIEGDLVLGGLMMVHERSDNLTCGPVMPQGGVQALETMLYTLDIVNKLKLIPGVTLGAHVLDDCDRDTYGLEMAVDFIKGMYCLLLRGDLSISLLLLLVRINLVQMARFKQRRI